MRSGTKARAKSGTRVIADVAGVRNQMKGQGPRYLPLNMGDMTVLLHTARQ
jgi:hypothetical protein